MTTSAKLRAPLELDSGAFRTALSGSGADEIPAIRAVADLFENALCARASDIHLEPDGAGGRVRQRVDGVLREVDRLDASAFLPVVSRIKLVAGMDIADKRLPQDGRYRAAVGGRTVDARVSSMPTVEGEKLVIRILDAGTRVPALEELGIPPGMCAHYRRLATAPVGLVLACGPTGCGKTTTLYASLAARNATTEHLCSVEDPVEMRLPGVVQVQVNVRAGVTFASAFRAFLRQDPDAIMVGEIRDPETAAVAASAALCGRMVFATLHSGDAIEAIERLVELGVPPARVAGAVSCVIAQRLVRRLCGYCRQGSTPSACAHCAGTGYYGRTGAFELLELAAAMREAIQAGHGREALRRVARDIGYVPMREAVDPYELSTSQDELERVLGGASRT